MNVKLTLFRNRIATILVAGTLSVLISIGIIAAVVGLCVWLLFLEPLLLGDVPSAGKYAPEATAGAIAGAIQSQIADSLVAPALGVVLLAAYAALAGLAGSLLITRRDIA